MNIKEIKKIARKKNYDSFWLDLLPRRFGSYIVYLLQKTSITPNHITILSFISSIFGILLIAATPYKIIGAFFYFIGLVLDCTDGQLARLKGMGSKFGKWLDGFVDEMVRGLLYIGLSLAVYSQTGNILFLFIGLWVCVAEYNVSFSNVNNIMTFGASTKEIIRKKYTIKSLFRYDPTIPRLIVLAAAIIGRLDYALITLAIINTIILIGQFLMTTRRRGE